MIEMISGSTRIGGRIVWPDDGPFIADPDVEARLVRVGVARYVYHADRTTADAVREAETGQAGFSVETPPYTAEPPVSEKSKPPAVEETAGAVQDKAEIRKKNDSGAESGVETGMVGHEAEPFDEESLNALTNAHLKEIAEGLGLDTSAMRKKADYVEAILAAQDSDAEEDDGETPPELDAEEPVS